MCVLHWINSCWLSITYLVIFETQKHILPKYLLGSSAMCASENSASISATNSLFVFLIVLCGKQKRHLTVVTCLSRVSLERYLNLDVVVVTKKKNQSINTPTLLALKEEDWHTSLASRANLLGTFETIFNGLKHRNDRSIRKSKGRACSTRMVIHLHVSCV